MYNIITMPDLALVSYVTHVEKCFLIKGTFTHFSVSCNVFLPCKPMKAV